VAPTLRGRAARVSLPTCEAVVLSVPDVVGPVGCTPESKHVGATLAVGIQQAKPLAAAAGAYWSTGGDPLWPAPFFAAPDKQFR